MKIAVYALALTLVLSVTLLPVVPERLVVSAQSSAPELKKIRPTVVAAGTRTFTVRLEGRGFDQAASVLFDGVPLASPRVTTKKGKVLLAEVNAALVASPGTHTIQALNSDGSTSTGLTLTVQEQDPDLAIRLDTNSVQEDSGLVFLPVVATDSFEEGSEFVVWGKVVPAARVTRGVQIEIPPGFVNDTASLTVTLRDKDGNISNSELFFVVPQPAEISFLDPDTIEVGTEDVPLEVHGGFEEDAVVLVNDMELPTTLGKNRRLEVVIPGSLRSEPRRLVVRVEQDGIQTQDSILTVTPTDGPFIFSIAPSRIRVGERKPSVEVIGANFDGNSKPFIDGQEANVRDSNRRRLTIAIPAELGVGQHTVQVADKDGLLTNTVSFEVVPDVEVTTLTGNGRFGFNEGCVSRDQAEFARPRRMSFGPDGLLYVTDQQNHAVRAVDVDSGETCTIAGTGLEGYHDSGNVAGKLPTFSFPSGIAVDGAGTIYVSENGNNVIRRIQRSGDTISVESFAGIFNEITNEDRQERFNSTRAGVASFRDAVALGAGFRLPDEMIIAPDGSIYVADAGNHAIRRISTVAGQRVVETIAGNGVPGFADGMAGRSRFNTPTSIVLSADGNFLFVTDTNNNRIRRIDLVNRRVSTVAGGGLDNLIDGPGGQSTLFQPIGLALDSDGVLYVAELQANDIRRIDSAGNVTTLAGEGNTKLRDGPGLEARFNQPRGLAIDRTRGFLYVADYENFVIRKIILR